MKKFTVGKNDEGQRLDKFLCKVLPQLPFSLMYKGIRTKNIKINGKRSEISTRLQINDEIAVYLPDDVLSPPEIYYDFLKAPDEIKILYEDDNIILFNKPAGLLVHPDSERDYDTLLSRMLKYLYSKGEYSPELENSFAPAFANRIDRNTCGIVIAAKNAESLRILNDKIKHREIDKYYKCIVHGRPPKTSDLLTAYLFKDRKENRVYVYSSSKKGTMEIRTAYKLLSSKKDYSLLEIKLITGRTHQIRAHMAHIGHPLAGDGKYGVHPEDKSKGFNFQALCSYKLQFSFKTDSGILEYLRGKSFVIDDIWFQSKFNTL